jgi:hypothetical protein
VFGSISRSPNSLASIGIPKQLDPTPLRLLGATPRKGNPGRGERRGFRSGRLWFAGYLIVLLNRTAARDHQFRLHVSNQNDVSPRLFGLASRQTAWAPGTTGSKPRSRELRSKRLGAEKSGVGVVSIRRREAVGLGHGDVRTKPIPMIWTERQQTVLSQVSGVLALPTIAGLYERAA